MEGGTTSPAFEEAIQVYLLKATSLPYPLIQQSPRKETL